jgi:uncharacterized membrane protein
MSKYTATFLALLFVCIAAEFAWAYALKPIYLPYRIDMPINPETQASFIINQPLTFVKMVIYNYFNFRGYYIRTFFGQLTWLDLYVPAYLIVFYCILTIITATLDKNLEISVSKFNKLIFSVIIIGTAFLIGALLYMTWSQIQGDTIEGIQGRYFIPIAPLIFLLCYNKKLQWKNFNRYVPLIVFIAVVFSMIVTLNTVFNRYYI